MGFIIDLVTESVVPAGTSLAQVVCANSHAMHTELWAVESD